ncbi:MAG TPA: hypothetical protein VF756_06820 [Thermoanaerobaculia bacterium]
MNPNLSIAQVLAEMEAQIALHESQEAFHAQQEVFHREQRALHAEALARVRERYETFKAGVSAAGEVVQGQPPAPPPKVEKEIDASRRGAKIEMVARIVATKGSEETFTSEGVARELNQRFADKLRRPVDARTVSVCLRRLLVDGRLRLVKKGGAYHPAVYGRRSGAQK